MSHQAGVSITKLRFDKSPNIIMGGERNRPTQLETTLWIQKYVTGKYSLYLNYREHFSKAKI